VVGFYFIICHFRDSSGESLSALGIPDAGDDLRRLREAVADSSSMTSRTLTEGRGLNVGPGGPEHTASGSSSPTPRITHSEDLATRTSVYTIDPWGKSPGSGSRFVGHHRSSSSSCCSSCSSRAHAGGGNRVMEPAAGEAYDEGLSEGHLADRGRMRPQELTEIKESRVALSSRSSAPASRRVPLVGPQMW